MSGRIVLLLYLILSLSAAFAHEGHGPGQPQFALQQRVFAVIRGYWACNELLVEYASQRSPQTLARYEAAYSVFEGESAALGQELASSLEAGPEKVRLLSDVYKNMPPAARVSLYPALRCLRAGAVHSDRARLSKGAFDKYFPGYGYAEPGFAYRKGREVSREAKGSTWVTEDRTIKAAASVELVVNISLLPHFQALEAAGTIKNLQVSDPFERARAGSSRSSVKITFQASQDLVIKTHRRFEVSKIWFELLRAKGDAWWTTGPWEVCGKTYEILDEPTGDADVTDVR